MKIKWFYTTKAYIKCDICGKLIGTEIFGYRKKKIYEWSKYDLCRECALSLENMVREKVQNKEAE